jgi:glycosyltransferase involved in cell wall biosynthesis
MGNWTARWKRFTIAGRDRLLHDPAVRHVTARILLARLKDSSRITDPTELARSIRQLCRIARLSREDSFIQDIEAENSRRVDLIGDRPVNWAEMISDWKTNRLEKAVVLKRWISPRERGVVLVSFDYQWPRLLGIPDVAAFSRLYRVVLAPTWSPPHCTETTLFPSQYPDEHLYTLISNEQDVRIFPRLSRKFRVVPIYASNWVNPDLYSPLPGAQKDIDIVMLAGFGAYKRHFALFEALRQLPMDLRVVLLGAPSGGRSASDLHAEAAAYGVRGRFELRESVSDAEVARCLARAKISLILSKQEGSCVAVTESMFAGTPVGIYEDAIIGSRTFINSQTGKLLRRDNLSAQLAEFLAEADSCSPRQWAMENNISCHGSTATLNGMIRADALAAGESWTEDIAVHHWRPDPVLLHVADRDRLQPSYEAIYSRFGMLLGPATRSM